MSTLSFFFLSNDLNTVIDITYHTFRFVVSLENKTTVPLAHRQTGKLAKVFVKLHTEFLCLLILVEYLY